MELFVRPSDQTLFRNEKAKYQVIEPYYMHGSNPDAFGPVTVHEYFIHSNIARTND